MFEELNRFIGWSLKCLPENELILISDKNTDGSFLLHHFISMYLKAGANVVLLTVAQSFSHYNVACSKLGVNLERSKNENKLHVLDLLDANLKVCLTSDDVKNTDALLQGFEQYSMKHFYEKIKSCISTDFSSVVILDDASMLLSLGFSVNDLTNFVHYMKVLSHTKKFSFVTLFHQDVASQKVKPSLYLNCQLYLTYEIMVQGLDSGYCKDVHGSLLLAKKSKDYKQTLTKKEMQFRVTDKALYLFAPGTSSAVL